MRVITEQENDLGFRTNNTFERKVIMSLRKAGNCAFTKKLRQDSGSANTSWCPSKPKSY